MRVCELAVDPCFCGEAIADVWVSVWRHDLDGTMEFEGLDPGLVDVGRASGADQRQQDAGAEFVALFG